MDHHRNSPFSFLPPREAYSPYLLLDILNFSAQSLDAPSQFLNLLLGVAQAVPLSSSCVLQSFILLGRKNELKKINHVQIIEMLQMSLTVPHNPNCQTTMEGAENLY